MKNKQTLDRSGAIGAFKSPPAEIFTHIKENEAPDLVNRPPHYQSFSNGAEVLDIVENLTFNAGNAVKYLARSCRIDGANKGEIMQDLYKARRYVEREIERLQKLDS